MTALTVSGITFCRQIKPNQRESRIPTLPQFHLCLLPQFLNSGTAFPKNYNMTLGGEVLSKQVTAHCTLYIALDIAHYTTHCTLHCTLHTKLDIAHYSV